MSKPVPAENDEGLSDPFHAALFEQPPTPQQARRSEAGVPEPLAENETDRASEKQAYADLLDFIRANQDPDTEVTCLTPDEYINGID